MIRFCLVDVLLLVAFCYCSLSAILRKKVGKPNGRNQKPIRIHICQFVYMNFLYNFIYVNSYDLRIYWYNFLYVSLYDLRIHIIGIMFSSIVQKGYFHGHNMLPPSTLQHCCRHQATAATAKLLPPPPPHCRRRAAATANTALPPPLPPRFCQAAATAAVAFIFICCHCCHCSFRCCCRRHF